MMNNLQKQCPFGYYQMAALWSLQLQTEKCQTSGTFLETELHHNHYGSLLPFALWVHSRVTFHHAPFILVALLYKQQPQQQQLTRSSTSCSSRTLYRRHYCWNMEPQGICVCVCVLVYVYVCACMCIKEGSCFCFCGMALLHWPYLCVI